MIWARPRNLTGRRSPCGRTSSDTFRMELLALTTAVARAGEPAQAGRFLDVLLEGIIPRPAGQAR